MKPTFSRESITKSHRLIEGDSATGYCPSIHVQFNFGSGISTQQPLDGFRATQQNLPGLNLVETIFDSGLVIVVAAIWHGTGRSQAPTHGSTTPLALLAAPGDVPRRSLPLRLQLLLWGYCCLGAALGVHLGRLTLADGL